MRYFTSDVQPFIMKPRTLLAKAGSEAASLPSIHFLVGEFLHQFDPSACTLLNGHLTVCTQDFLIHAFHYKKE